MQSGFGFDGERLSLLVRIGCGERAYLGDERIADKLMLVEPDPERAQSARTWLQQTGAGVLVEAAVADEDGEGTFRRTSFADMNSLRGGTGAIALFPGVRALETCTVKTVKPRNLFQAGLEDASNGPRGLIVDAPSEVLLVLDDLHRAGLLAKFSHIIVRVSEEPLHEGGADRRALGAWIADAEYTLSWEEDPTDPDVRYARLHPDWRAKIVRRESQIEALEGALEEARRSYAVASEEAQSSLTAYEGVLSERDELSEKNDALQRSLSGVSADLEASRGALDVVREEREALEASWLQDAEARQASLTQLREQLAKLREERDSLDEARGTAEADLASTREALAKLREERDSLDEARGTAEADLASTREELAKLREERDSLDEARGTAEADLASTREELAKLQEELAKLREERDNLKEARAGALKDSEANLQAFEAMRAERDRLKSSLSAATERADEQAQSLQRLGAELEELRDDNRLSLRIQRIAQADLADLQDRYAALSGEKRELEAFLDELAENVAQAMAVSEATHDEQLAAPSGASSKSSGSKSARRSRKSRAQSS